MSKAPASPKVSNLNDLLAVAYQIEIDAVDRYKMLADQMETHNNAELTKVFRDLARAEGIHGEEIRRMAGDFDVAAHAREISKFAGESPEEADLGEAHYLMTPWHALQMSLAGEERALAYFTSIVENAKDEKVKTLGRRAGRGGSRARAARAQAAAALSQAGRELGGRSRSAAVVGIEIFARRLFDTERKRTTSPLSLPGLTRQSMRRCGKYRLP